ncbi:MAG TPA: hypothetical protein VF767_10245 [Bryobacteraceae bacterium]
MLTSNLLQIASDHWEQIATRVVLRIRRDSKFLEMGKLPESEIRSRTREILLNLGNWLVSSEDDLGLRYEHLGGRRFQEGIPMHEVVYALQVIHQSMIQYIRDQGLGRTPLDMYAEEELEVGSGRIFDRIVYYFVRGYERAMREHFRAMTATASARR